MSKGLRSAFKRLKREFADGAERYPGLQHVMALRWGKIEPPSAIPERTPSGEGLTRMDLTDTDGFEFVSLTHASSKKDARRQKRSEWFSIRGKYVSCQSPPVGLDSWFFGGTEGLDHFKALAEDAGRCLIIYLTFISHS